MKLEPKQIPEIFVDIDQANQVKQDTSKSLSQKKEKHLIIRRDDTPEKVKHFLAALEMTGFSLRKSSYQHRQGFLNHIFLWFRHAQGLNFKLRGTRFDQLEIKVYNDQKKGIQYFIYRFNQEKFSKAIPLICKGYKTHIYGDGFQGISGRTNINISKD